jgi:hypothetical protein
MSKVQSAPPPTIFLSFQKPHLDKANKKLFTNKSNFRLAMGFSLHESETGNHPNPTSPRCYRSNSDSIQQQPQQQQPRYSSSSSSSSCTDDDLSSEGSIDSGGAVGGGRKTYKL